MDSFKLEGFLEKLSPTKFVGWQVNKSIDLSTVEVFYTEAEKVDLL